MCARGTTELLEGPKVKRLLDLLKESKATLIAVGAGTSHRGIGIAFGDVATEMLHRARAALCVARDLAERFDTRVRVVTADDAALTPFDELAEIERERDDRPSVAALLAASAGADLLIVGRRGLRGLSAISSVSERIGHQASCSVLVVRPTDATESDA